MGRAASARLETDPYDLDAWSLVIREAQTKPVDHSRDTFERLVEKFPTSGRYWKMYIDHEMRGRDYERVEKVNGGQHKRSSNVSAPFLIACQNIKEKERYV